MEDRAIFFPVNMVHPCVRHRWHGLGIDLDLAQKGLGSYVVRFWLYLNPESPLSIVTGMEAFPCAPPLVFVCLCHSDTDEDQKVYRVWFD